MCGELEMASESTWVWCDLDHAEQHRVCAGCGESMCRGVECVQGCGVRSAGVECGVQVWRGLSEYVCVREKESRNERRVEACSVLALRESTTPRFHVMCREWEAAQGAPLQVHRCVVL